MPIVPARRALQYAISRELALLYFVVAAGYVAMVLGGGFALRWAVRGGSAGTVGAILAAVFTAVGFLFVLGGVVAFVYKVIADANADALRAER